MTDAELAAMWNQHEYCPECKGTHMRDVSKAAKVNVFETRKHYIDNLRCACILLLVPFHAAMAWNCWGEGNYIWFSNNKILSSFVTFISPWYMTLLFVLAGMSLFYSLRKRTAGQVIKERLLKLALPLVAGVLTVVPVMTYYADKFHTGYKGSFWEHYKIFFTRFTTLTGYDGGFSPAHLWFLLYLFIISLLCLGIISLQKRFVPKLPQGFSLGNLSIKQQLVMVYGLGIFPILLTPVLNIGGKSVGSYFAFFLIGYYVFSKEDVMTLVVRTRWINFGFMMIFDILDTYMFIWSDSANSAINTIAMYFTCWFGILAMLGLGKSYFNQNNRIMEYLKDRSFVFYIFHFIWVIILQYYTCKFTSSVFLLVIVSVVGTYILTFLTIEIVIRIPVVNCLFGVKRKLK